MDDQPGTAGVKTERDVASRFHAGFEPRLALTFLAWAAVWVCIVAAGIAGAIPLWLGFILGAVTATTFYMPLHEAAHGNIWGSTTRLRSMEQVIGVLCSIPLGFDFYAHRAEHLRHHAHTNNPDRDPDHYTDGTIAELVVKWASLVVVFTFMPFVKLTPWAFRWLPAQVQHSLSEVNRGGRATELKQFRYWLITHVTLAAAFFVGVGWEAMVVWYLPARLSALWLLFVFAWFPHHPATETGRYESTRIAVFTLSGFLTRGHDHHAIHHLFPRIPHYRLAEVWDELADDLVAKGVPSQGRARAATSPIVWK